MARDFLVRADVAAQGQAADVERAFSVDGTLIDAWASMKSFRPRDGSGDPPQPGRNGERDFRGEKRSNDTHASTTDPDARLYRKANGRESRLCYMGHALMENRNGLVVDAELTLASGVAEREAALAMLDRRKAKSRRITLAADKAYDVEAFVGSLRARQVTPHIAVNGSVSRTGKIRKTAIDKRTTRHPGYGISLRCRKRIEEVFGWIKAQAGFTKVKVRGRPKVAAVFGFAVAAYNLVRLPKLLAQAAT
ncbi:transposase, IS4 [Nitratireductor aquibiodomus RA22]|uniref:Transposase, IS4 n=1 Tax=Nitratireductor aquibiodomus RA22 TaxID=1189611 RepID=I5BPS4_9HYPH|nr:transposase, IS4 [Nitratireductor aquibiodomus RA22]